MIKCDRDNHSKNKNVIGILIHVRGPDIGLANRDSVFSTIPRIIPSKPSWPTVEVVQANEFKALLFAGAWPCLVGPGWGLAGAWPGLAGAWLTPGRDLAGPRQQPTGIPVDPVGFVRLQSIGNLKITNYQLNSKTAKNIVKHCIFVVFEFNW